MPACRRPAAQFRSLPTCAPAGRFIGADADRPGYKGIATGIAGQPEAARRAFLDQYGSLFGVAGGGSMTVVKQNTEAAGAGSRTYLRFQQTLSGIPVMGGELIVQVDDAGRVWSASGETLPEETASQLATAPTISAEAAAATAWPLP